MQIDDMPYCCTAVVACDFEFDSEITKAAGEVLKARLKEEAAYWYADGAAVLIATLTTRQEKAKKVLVELGFICSEPMKKKRHKDRDLYVLYLPLEKWAKSNVKQIPRDAKGRFIKANPFK